MRRARLWDVNDLDALLTHLIENVDGAQAAVIGDMDGLLIEQYPQVSTDLSPVTAQWTNVMGNLKMVADGLGGGNVKEIMLTADKLICYARLLSDDLFCFIIMNPSGNIGKARLYSDKMAERLLEVFA